MKKLERRPRQRKQASAAPAAENLLTIPPADEEQLRRVARAIKKLERRQREVLLMCAGWGLTYEEIGAKLDLTPAEVERCLAKALYEVATRLGRQKRLGGGFGDAPAGSKSPSLSLRRTLMKWRK